ncbi:MAG: DUF2975 domain-containing protein [Bacteroidales bacterium]|nr:DUF2975 domain-containing protein [Bacteroidales bacterium]
MKKNSINALCILVIGFLLAYIVLPALLFLVGRGSTLGNYSSETPTTVMNTTPVMVNFHPQTQELLSPKNNLLFKTGEKLPVVLQQGIVMVPDAKADSAFSSGAIIDILISVLTLAAFVLLLIDFIKFIININKGKIFERLNIRYLSRFGLYLIIIGLLDCISGLIQETTFSQYGLSLIGYELSTGWSIPWADFLLGCFALLLARIWAVGMSMKEDQQLTI